MKKSIALVVIIALWTSLTQAQDFTEVVNHGLPAVGRSAIVWADVDNDGWLDAIITGVDTQGDAISQLYRNNGDQSFSNFGAGFTPVKDGAIAVGDVNNDHWIDILLTGSDQNDVAISKLYINEGGGIFTESAMLFPGITSGSAVLQDLNNDGLTDVLLAGVTTSGDRLTYLYQNEGSAVFTETAHPLPGVGYGSVVLFDINHDTYLDVLLNGIDEKNQTTTALYVNQGKFSFVKKDVDLPNIRMGSVTPSDYNQDGYTDLLIAGAQKNSALVTALYQGRANQTFVLDQTLEAVSEPAVAWGDYDLDGDPDLLYTGWQNSSTETYLYQNQTVSFGMKSSTPFPPIGGGSVTWTHLDQDHTLDILLTGITTNQYNSHLYQNTALGKNTLPTAPTNLSVVSRGDSVVLQWDRATDTETLPASLTYEIYLGTAAGQSDIVAPLSDISDGRRKTIAYGRYQTTQAVIRNLPEGEYFWSVQAVDHSYAGSPFSAEQRFTICYDFAIEATALSACQYDTITLRAGNENDQVRWFTSQDSAVPFSTDQEIFFPVTEDAQVWAELTRQPLGCVRYDTVQIVAHTLPIVTLGNDTAVCYQQTISLTVAETEDSVNWYSLQEGLVGQGTPVYQHTGLLKDTVVVEQISRFHCASYDTIVVDVIPLPVVDLGANRSVCYQSTTTLSVANTADTIRWYSAQFGWLATGSTVDWRAVQTDTLWVEVINQTGCIAYDTIIMTVRQPPLSRAGVDRIVCAGSATVLGKAPPSNTLTFAWSPTIGLNKANIAQPTASPDTTTAYVLQVTDSWGCTAYDTVVVQVDNPSVINAGYDRTICLEESTLLGGEPTAQGSLLPYQYTWFPSETLDDPTLANPTASPLETTQYAVVVRTGECIIDTAYLTVTVRLPPVVDVSEGITIGFQEEAQLVVQGGVAYQWSPAKGLNNSMIANPVASPDETTTYTVLVTDSLGCQATSEVTVRVENEIFVPNLFTPNSDGNNDFFRLYGYGIQHVVFRIFTSSGELVYETSDVNKATGQGWDGTFRQVPQRMGNYLWTIQGNFYNGKPITFQGKNSGTIQLVR